MTLARYFLKLRSDSGLSLRAIAAKAKLDPTAVWKIEHGKTVRAQTLGLVLRAMGLSEKDDTFIEAFALWSTEQAGTLPTSVVRASGVKIRKKNDREFARLLEAAAAALRAVPDADRALVIEALKHPEALCLWVKSRK